MGKTAKPEEIIAKLREVVAFDIVVAGYDAGVRLGEVIEQDLVAIPLTGDQRETVVAAPAYLAAHGAPAHPRELVHHRCIG